MARLRNTAPHYATVITLLCLNPWPAIAAPVIGGNPGGGGVAGIRCEANTSCELRSVYACKDSNTGGAIQTYGGYYTVVEIDANGNSNVIEQKNLVQMFGKPNTITETVKGNWSGANAGDPCQMTGATSPVGVYINWGTWTHRFTYGGCVLTGPGAWGGVNCQSGGVEPPDPVQVCRWTTNASLIRELGERTRDSVKGTWTGSPFAFVVKCTGTSGGGEANMEINVNSPINNGVTVNVVECSSGNDVSEIHKKLEGETTDLCIKTEGDAEKLGEMSAEAVMTVTYK